MNPRGVPSDYLQCWSRGDDGTAIGARAVGWTESEMDEWAQARIVGTPERCGVRVSAGIGSRPARSYVSWAGHELAQEGWQMGRKKGGKTTTRKIGRDAGTGRFIPVKEAQRRKKTAVVERIKRKK